MDERLLPDDRRPPPPCAKCGAYLEADDGPCPFCPDGVVVRVGDST